MITLLREASLCAGLTLLLLFFRVVRLSTVVCLALKLTWALVHWFVTFSVYYCNVPFPVVWCGWELGLGEQLVILLVTIFRGCPSTSVLWASWSHTEWYSRVRQDTEKVMPCSFREFEESSVNSESQPETASFSLILAPGLPCLSLP